MYLVNIFFDNHNNFQWASIAAFIAFIGSCASVWIAWLNNKNTIGKQEQMSQANLDLQEKMNKSNFKGNVVSKARIEWIQEVRKLSVAFISSFYNLANYVKELELDGFFNEADHKKRIEKIKKNHELMKLINTLKEKGTLLILYFGPDTSKNINNEFINYIVSLIMDRADQMGVSEEANSFLRQEDNIRSLKDFLRIYLKAEWKRANGELKDSDIQGYLDNNDVYNYIIKIYEYGFATHLECVEYFYIDKLNKELRRD
ncbi:hypothetical protein [Bacillus thuringiensis]|uniref:hypothetical protein n=1 Tax=Bacillus thuringiensis TaxID=1428 RepID=UPI000BF55C0A|nr:hypothetical protein [Bacillus thuringiensis]PEZ31990.1 hypothetical protein CN346_19065 [Bacillus thuringiensis]